MIATKTKNISALPSKCDIKLELKQLMVSNGNELIPTEEYCVFDTINNELVRVCKAGYNITQNSEIYEAVELYAKEFGWIITDVDTFKTNQGIFVVLDTNFAIPIEVSHLIKGIEVFIFDGNSQDVGLTSGLLIELITGNKVVFNSSFMKSGMRSSKIFAERKKIIPKIVSKATIVAESIIKNLIKNSNKVGGIEKTFVTTNYQKSSIGGIIKGENGKFESNILELTESVKLFTKEYKDKSLSGLIVGFINGMVEKFVPNEGEEKYTQGFIPQTTINKKLTPFFENFLTKV